MSESGDSVESETVTERTDVGEQAQAGPHLDVRHSERSGRSVIFDLQDVSVLYASFRAVRDVSLPIRENEITALIGPSGCGKTTVLRCLNRMNDLIEGARVEGTILYHGIDLYDARVDPVEVRRRVGMVFQKPNPFPKSIYDNVSFGPKIAGYRGSMDDLVEESLTRAALWDEVKDKLKESGMALSGARPDRHATDRGADAGARGRLHDRDRDPQHAAGCSGQRPDGVLHGRRARGRSADRHAGRVRPDRSHVHEPVGEADRGLRHRPVRLDGASRGAPAPRGGVADHHVVEELPPQGLRHPLEARTRLDQRVRLGRPGHAGRQAAELVHDVGQPEDGRGHRGKVGGPAGQAFDDTGRLVVGGLRELGLAELAAGADDRPRGEAHRAVANGRVRHRGRRSAVSAASERTAVVPTRRRAAAATSSRGCSSGRRPARSRARAGRPSGGRVGVVTTVSRYRGGVAVRGRTCERRTAAGGTFRRRPDPPLGVGAGPAGCGVGQSAGVISRSWPSSTVPGRGAVVGECACTSVSQVSGPNIADASTMPLVSHTPGPTGMPSRPGGSSSATRSPSGSTREVHGPPPRSKRHTLPSRPLAAMTRRLSVTPSSLIIRKPSPTSTLSGLMAVSPPSAITSSALYTTCRPAFPRTFPGLSRSVYRRPSSFSPPVLDPVVTKWNRFRCWRSKAPSSGRTKAKAPRASTAASSWTSVMPSAPGIRTHSPPIVPSAKVASEFAPGVVERKTYSCPSTSPLRSRTLSECGRFRPTNRYSWESGVAGPSSRESITVRLPVPDKTRVFSLEKRP